MFVNLRVMFFRYLDSLMRIWRHINIDESDVNVKMSDMRSGTYLKSTLQHKSLQIATERQCAQGIWCLQGVWSARLVAAKKIFLTRILRICDKNKNDWRFFFALVY